jgi:hypothetical protein
VRQSKSGLLSFPRNYKTKTKILTSDKHSRLLSRLFVKNIFKLKASVKVVFFCHWNFGRNKLKCLSPVNLTT